MNKLFDLKHHNSFQNQSNRKATHSFAPRRLIFKLKQEVLKFNELELHKNGPGDKYLNPGNQSFENVPIVTFK